MLQCGTTKSIGFCEDLYIKPHSKIFTSVQEMRCIGLFEFLLFVYIKKMCISSFSLLVSSRSNSKDKQGERFSNNIYNKNSFIKQV